MDSHEKTADLFNSFLGANLIPTITKPTRITHTSATLIDNIYTRHTDVTQTASGVIPLDISDHFPVFCFTGKSKQILKNQSPLTFKYRPSDSNTFARLKQTLSSIDWNYLDSLDSNSASAEFVERLNSIYHHCAPEREVVIPAKYIMREEWMTKGLMKSSSTLTKLYKKSVKKAKTDPLHLRYIEYRNKYNKLKRIAKERYFQSLFDQSKNDMKKTWQTLNSLIGRTRDKSNIHSLFKYKGKVINDPTAIADGFCDYFSNIGPQLSATIPVSSKDEESYLMSKRTRNTRSIFVSPTDPEEVRKIILGMKSKRSSGHDSMSTSFLKQIATEICSPLSLLINKSFEEGKVPECLKMAVVIPIYKSQDHDLFSNYRPISLLPSISKVFEKVMYKRLNGFLEINEILYQSQYGFRGSHSTVQAIHEFISNTVDAMENKMSTIGVFLDLSKAFDTINHKILLRKLDFYGIRGTALEWFTSYFNNRSQYVRYHNKESKTLSVKCGVPQGSVLGPLLFLIYVNDLPDSLTRVNSILFADDTSVYMSSMNIKELYTEMNAELKILSDWFRANKLSLNLRKSNYMLFSNTCKDTDKYEIKIDHVLLEKTNCVKFLGVYLDDKLTWSTHIKVCCSKVAGSIYALNRIKHLISKKYLRTLYFSIIYPYLSYGITLWGSAYKVHKRKLVVLQKRAIRIITGSRYNDSTQHLFYAQHMLKLEDLYKAEVAKLVFRHKSGSLPVPLRKLFKWNSDFRHRSTRQDDNLRVAKSRTTLASHYVTSTGPRIWNSLPVAIRNNTQVSFKIFAKRLINHYVEGYHT